MTFKEGFGGIIFALAMVTCYNSPSFAATPGGLDNLPPQVQQRQLPDNCVEITEYMAKYFGSDPAVGYGYSSTDAEKLIAVLGKMYGPPPTRTNLPAVLVFVAIDLVDTEHTVDWFLADINGCFTAELRSRKMSDSLKWFDEAGVSPDFGPTFYKLPDDSKHPFGEVPNLDKPKDHSI